MKKRNLVAGMLALVLIFAGLTSCAYERTAIKDVPVEQRASLYFVDRKENAAKGYKDNFDTLDGNRTNLLGMGLVSKKTKDQQLSKPLLQVAAGEHTIGVSTPRDLLPGRKKYEATYNFEAGKRYQIQIGVDPSLSPGEKLKADLGENYIVIITDMDAPKEEKPKIEINFDFSGGK